MDLIIKKRKMFLIIGLIFLLFELKANAAVILVDPGHGGEDFGARGLDQKEEVLEKELSLQISKRLHKKLQKNHHVYLTRSFDRAISLQERAGLAEKLKADIFISIHLNSSTVKNSHGFEIYYLDNHQDVAIKKVEDVENKEMQAVDESIRHILTDLVVANTVDYSKKLAHAIHSKAKEGVIKRFGVKDRGVRAGLFYVLALSKRPGVLVEAGFMSNEKELKRLKTEQFQESVAEAVAQGVASFLKPELKIKNAPSLF